MTKKTLLEQVTRLLPEAPEEALDFACGLTLQAICNYCNLPEAPDGLLFAAAAMARGLASRAGLGAGELQPEVKSVSRGDVTYSFASVTERMTQLAAVGDFLSDYRAQLNAYRKMR